MVFPRVLSVLVPSALVLNAGAVERPVGSLNYRVRIQFQGDDLPVETRFKLELTPPVQTHNHAKKPRMGGWRLEADQPKGANYNVTAVLARVERLLYLSGPTTSTVPRSILVRLGDRQCPVWQLQSPKNLQVYAYLAEVAPDVLALSYLSGKFQHGDLASVEIQLEDFHIGSGIGPAEDGTALMATLQRMASTKSDSVSGNVDGLTEQVSSD